VDFSAIAERILFVAAIAAFLLLFSILRRNPRKVRTDIVRTLLSETRVNLILTETFDRQPRPRRFETTGHILYKKKLDFLDKPLQDDLTAVLGMALDYNQRLKADKKNKSSDNIQPDIERLKAVLPRIKSGLEDWLLANVGSVDQPQRPSMFDGLFGR
jgi:hypothetical protein